MSPEQREQKYITHAAPAAADAAPSPPARKLRKKADAPAPDEAPAEPATPYVIREALATVCAIGKTASAEVRKDAASRAKAIWRAYRDAQTDDEIAADIRHVGQWCVKHAWQCRDGSAPRPKLIGDYWDQAMAAKAASAVRARAYVQPPEERRPTPEETAAHARTMPNPLEAARQRRSAQ